MGYQIAHVHSTSKEVLPKVKSEDEGKVLGVKDGQWAPVESEAADLATVAKTGEYSDLNNTPDLSVYADKAETEQAIQNIFNAIGDITQFKTLVVDELPAEGEAATIYFLRNGDEEGNACKEYIFIDGSWELIGDTSIDLTPYVTWDNIGAAAQSNDYEDLDNLPVIPSVPIALSEFVNDAGFITSDDVPKNVSELNNDAEYMTANDISITDTIDASGDGYRNISIASINNHDITFPGHVMVQCGDLLDTDNNFVYAKLVKSLSNYISGSVETHYQVPIYSDEIIYPKQVVTKEYVDNAISNIPEAEVSYNKIVNRPTKVTDFENDANYIPKAEYDKVVKALDTLVAAQGKGARSADGEFYETAMEAVAAAEPNVPMEVALTTDEANGDAFVLKTADGDVNKIITFDLNGHEYAAAKADGSAGTQTQAIHLEKGNTVVIKGGTLSALTSNPDLKMMIQNYSNLVLEDMTIDCSDNANISYVVSNNFGSCTIKNCHIIPAAGKVAVDCWFGLSQVYDEGVHVVIEDSIIDGTIEYGAQRQALSRSGNEEWWKKAVLEINNSRIGQIVNSGADTDPTHCSITIDGEVAGFGDYSAQTADRPIH